MIQLLQEYIGEHDRGTCVFAQRMHSVVDALMEQLELAQTPKERHEVLQSVCCAMAKRPWQRDLFPGHQSRIVNWNPWPEALIVALVAEYDHVVRSILSTHANAAYVWTAFDGKVPNPQPIVSLEAWYFRTPLDVAITLGRTAQVQMLFSHGAVFNKRPWSSNCRASSLAAQRGHKDVLALLIGRLPGVLDHDTLQFTGELMAVAAAHQQWNVVRSILDRHDVASRSRMGTGCWNRILRFAARYGQERIVADVLPFASHRTTKGKLPLIEAARGGHLSTCKLLLKDCLPDRRHSSGRAEELARSVAIGGRIEICRLLKDLDLWKPCHEIRFLHIAAEHRHLELGKYAIEHSCDENPTKKHRQSVIPDLDRRVRYPEDIRYFALLCAIVSGHRDIVRWLIEEVGMDVGKDAELPHPELYPMDLAIEAGRTDMTSLLVDLRVNLGTARCVERCAHCQTAAAKSLKMYRNALFLREDGGPRWRVNTA